jgi:hypothetical protein
VAIFEWTFLTSSCFPVQFYLQDLWAWFFFIIIFCISLFFSAGVRVYLVFIFNVFFML